MLLSLSPANLFSGLLMQVTVPVPPLLILVLCVIAGIGTVLLLPSRWEPSLHRIGGTLLGAAGLILVAWLIHATAESGHGASIYFWVFATIAIVGATRVVTHPRPVYAALYFVLTVFATAGLFVLLWAEFMAAALVLIYAGAILITYVFVIMLAAQARNPDSAALPQVTEYDNVSREPLLASAVGFTLMGVLLMLIFDRGSALPVAAPAPIPVQGQTQQLGVYLFQNQIVNLELAGLILTVSMVGAILIARRRVIFPSLLPAAELVSAPSSPITDNPYSIPVYGTENPRQKEYPET